MKLLRISLAAAAVAATMVPMASHAASSSATGSGALSAPVNLNFNVVIPRFLFLRVGDAAAASVNTLVFSPTVAQMIASTPVSATGGDVSGTDITYQVFSNAASTTLAASALPNLSVSGNNIPTSTLAVTVPTGTLTPPAFGTSVALAGPVVNQTGTWRWTWTNQANTVYPAGTYTGTVTYTLAAP